MSASQISFAEFALASQQAVTPCAPPVLEAALAVVAHPLAADSGECIQPCADSAEFSRLTALAGSTAVIPFAAPCSAGGWVLMALANAVSPLWPGRPSQSALIDDVRYHAQCAIGAGC